MIDLNFLRLSDLNGRTEVAAAKEVAAATNRRRCIESNNSGLHQKGYEKEITAICFFKKISMLALPIG
jgi:hypothetical protein